MPEGVGELERISVRADLGKSTETCYMVGGHGYHEHPIL
jgi:hypothetical protein